MDTRSPLRSVHQSNWEAQYDVNNLDQYQAKVKEPTHKKRSGTASGTGTGTGTGSGTGLSPGSGPARKRRASQPSKKDPPAKRAKPGPASGTGTTSGTTSGTGTKDGVPGTSKNVRFQDSIDINRELVPQLVSLHDVKLVSRNILKHG